MKMLATIRNLFSQGAATRPVSSRNSSPLGAFGSALAKLVQWPVKNRRESGWAVLLIGMLAAYVVQDQAFTVPLFVLFFAVSTMDLLATTEARS